MIQEIADDMKQPHPMNRLLQGDVGSGKTIVAAQAAVIAIENGYQVAVLAPTEILAAQHYVYFRRLMEKLGYHGQSCSPDRRTAREKQQLKKLIAAGIRAGGRRHACAACSRMSNFTSSGSPLSMSSTGSACSAKRACTTD